MKNKFKLFFYPILILGIFSILISSCDEDFHLIKKVTIKGKIVRPHRKIAQNDSIQATDTITLADAEKVLIFFGNEYDLVDIKSDGSFSGRAPLGSATAVAFLTEDNEFIGNLFVGGLNFLPLNGDDLSEIDLSTLILVGDRVIPANDPIGTKIILSEDEILFMQEVGAYYEALAKNIDMNNDKIPDVLQNAFIAVNTYQSYEGGKWGLNNDTALLSPTTQFSIDYFVHMVGPTTLLSSADNSIPENASLSGPTGNPYSDIRNAGNSYSNTEEFKLNFARGNSGQYLPFEKGEYTLNIDKKDYTFSYSNINMLKFWVLAIPTLITNSQNEVTSIKLKFQFPNGSEIDPRKLLKTGIDIQINGNNNNQLEEILTSVYSSADPDFDYYNIIFETPFKLSDISSINLLYDDIFGNRGGNSWHP